MHNLLPGRNAWSWRGEGGQKKGPPYRQRTEDVTLAFACFSLYRRVGRSGHRAVKHSCQNRRTKFPVSPSIQPTNPERVTRSIQLTGFVGQECSFSASKPCTYASLLFAIYRRHGPTSLRAAGRFTSSGKAGLKRTFSVLHPPGTSAGILLV